MQPADRLRDQLQTASELARDQTLVPVHPALRGAVPGLRPGTVTTVSGVGATSLGLTLLAGASHDGTWTAAAGIPSLGIAAAGELGVALDRFVVVPDPGDSWTEAVAALVDAFELVLVCPPAGMRSADARRMATRVRERKAVLVACGGWPQAADLEVRVTTSRWHGIGPGHGRLTARELDIVARGRGAASMPRRATLWLPAPDGGIRAIEVGKASAPRVTVAGG